MKKYVDGKYINYTDKELLELKEESKQALYNERTRARTVEEGLLELNKALLAKELENNEDKTLAIACMSMFPTWTKGKYKVGDIYTSPNTGYPYECILEHDSTINTDWTIDIRTLWKPYHSKKKEYALPYEAPVGAHDIYKKGEYMIFTDKEIYLCLSDTNFSPLEYAQAWELVE